MKTSVRSLIVLLLILPVFLLAAARVSADDDSVGFSVNALLPDNQVNPEVSYFDLRVEPGKQQELQVEIHNHEKKELTVRLAVHPASTNSNGLIVYEEGEADPSLDWPLSELLSFKEEEVTIAGGESENVAATLNVPEESFEGVVLGGMHFEKAMEEEEDAEGVQITNKYAYVIGVQLSESDEPVAPELKLDQVEPGLVNFRTAVTAGLRNISPVLISGLSVKAEVLNEEGEPVREIQQENIRMAPNSEMDVVVDWDNRPLEPGTYRMVMTAVLGDDQWEWSEEFTVERAQARDINRSAVELKEEGTPAWMSIGFTGLAAVVVFLLLYIRRLRHQAPSQASGEE